MPDIPKNSNKGKEKAAQSSGKKFDVVRSQHPSQSELQHKHEKQLSGTPSERRTRLIALTKNLNSLELKKLNTGKKKKNPLEAIYSERKYGKISSFAPVRGFTVSRVQEKRKLRGGRDEEGISEQLARINLEDTSKQQEKGEDTTVQGPLRQERDISVRGGEARGSGTDNIESVTGKGFVYKLGQTDTGRWGRGRKNNFEPGD